MDGFDLIALLEKGGLPGAVLAGLIVAWRIGKDGRAEPPEAKIASAIDAMAQELKAQRLEMTDRFARIETDLANLKERK